MRKRNRSGCPPVRDAEESAAPIPPTQLGANGVRRVVDDLVDAFGVCAVRAAVERALRLDAVADDFTTTVLAYRRQFVDSTLEAVERVRAAGGDDLEGHFVVVTAHLAVGHCIAPQKKGAKVPASFRPRVEPAA